MTNDNPIPIKALLNIQEARELIRIDIEKAVNLLLKSELTKFLSYEKYDVNGYNSGNSRN